jgi:hypothetical protein
MSLKQLLYRHESSKYRGSRDKIYGLLALACDCKVKVQRVTAKFEPDYRKDLSEAYRDALMLKFPPPW